MSEIDQVLQRFTDPTTGSFHGISFVAIDSKGNDIYRKSFGSRTVDQSKNEPLTLDTLTWIASQTKLTASVSALQVVEKGLIGLDDDVREYLPALKEQKVLLGFEGDEGTGAREQLDIEALTKGGDALKGGAAAEDDKPIGQPIFEEVQGKITLRQLLSHSSGLAYDIGHPLLVKYSKWAKRQDNMFSGKIEGSTHPLVYQPGTSWQYGPGLDWAGRLVEVLTGKDLNDHQQENIWGPLGAKSTSFRPMKHFAPDGPPPTQETAYHTENGLVAGPSLWPFEPRDAIGGAGLYSTPNDYIRLLGALLRDGAPLLSKESVDTLFSAQLGAGSVKALRDFLVTDSVERSLARLWATSDETYADIQEIQGSLVGPLSTEDIPGRRKKGTVSWGGLPNLSWWIDRESGVAATVFTQLVPPGDANSRKLLLDLEPALYRLYEANKA